MANATAEECAFFMPQGQSCSTPLKPGDYANINLPKIQIPEIPPDILNQLKMVKSLKIELTLMNSKFLDSACMSTKIDIHVPDDDDTTTTTATTTTTTTTTTPKNNGMKMFNSNVILGAMLLLNFLYI